MSYLHPSLGTPRVERRHSCRAPNRLRGRGEALVELAWEADDGQWADWLRVPLRLAARKGNLDMVNALVGAGAACSGMNREDTTSLLHEAVASGSLSIVKALLGCGATTDVDTGARKRGSTPLHCAVDRRHREIMLALLEAGADANVADVTGSTPLMRAAAGGDSDFVRSLLLRDASLHAKDVRGMQALHYAIEQHHAEVTRILIAAGAPTFTFAEYTHQAPETAFLHSPLGNAVRYEDTGIVRELLESAQSAGFISHFGNIALEYAVIDERVDMIHLLVEAGADVNGQCAPRRPLHVACARAKLDSVDTLLQLGADETRTDVSGNTPVRVVASDVKPNALVECKAQEIREALARAPANRAWRRRGWLVMLRARVCSGGTPGNDAMQRQRERDGSEICEVEECRKDACIPSAGIQRFLEAFEALLVVPDEHVFRSVVAFL